MCIHIKNSLFLIFFLLAAPVIGADSHPIKIGVEIETSSIKTDIGEGNNLGFIICDSKRKPLWVIEEDTSDQFFKGTSWHDFGNNLEVKTIGGFDDREFFLKKLETMTKVISRLYNESLKSSFKINIGTLGSIVHEIEKNNDLFIDFKDRDEYKKYFKIKSNPDKKIVRPQITYQLPLNKIPYLFKRLETIGDKTIKDFLASLGNHFKKHEFSGIKNPSTWQHIPKVQKRYENEKHRNEILNYFNENFSKELENCSENVRGFSYLFLYYWRNIFNNNTLEEKKEPGPKQFLSIMSRTPLSQIYESLLEDEKTEFKKIFGGHIAEHGQRYMIREYYTPGGEKSDGKRLTLGDWYQSIVDEKDRVKRMKEATNGNFIRYSVDKLSPPPDLPDDYSMGFIVDSTKSPLLEGRSYARMSFDDEEIDIDNVEAFITREANWFFTEIK